MADPSPHAQCHNLTIKAHIQTSRTDLPYGKSVFLDVASLRHVILEDEFGAAGGGSVAAEELHEVRAAIVVVIDRESETDLGGAQAVDVIPSRPLDIGVVP